MDFGDLPWSTISAAASAVAAIAAAVATWRAPRSAAFLAETLRRETENATRRRAAKEEVFSVLMAGRARPDAPDVASAFNRIDFVFADCQPVRGRWAELLDALRRAIEWEVQAALARLLGAMAQELGLSDGITASDLERVYHPRSLEFDRLARQITNE